MCKGYYSSRVKRVVAKYDSVPMKWSKSNEITENMFKEAGVIYDKVRSKGNRE